MKAQSDKYFMWIESDQFGSIRLPPLEQLIRTKSGWRIPPRFGGGCDQPGVLLWEETPRWVSSPISFSLMDAVMFVVCGVSMSENVPQLCDGTCSNDRARTSAKVMLAGWGARL
jgi:hypothetical protein